MSEQASFVGVWDSHVLVPDPTAPTTKCALPSLSNLSSTVRLGVLGTNNVHERQRRGQLVRVLQEVMIRHTKSQRIGGDVALALPDSQSSTVWLTMTPDERTLYSQSVRSASDIPLRGIDRSAFEMHQARVRQACSHSCRSQSCAPVRLAMSWHLAPGRPGWSILLY